MLLALTGLCSLGAIAALVTAVDVAWCVLTARQATTLANPPRISKLIILFVILVSAGALLGTVVRRVTQSGSPQRGVASRWSLGSLVLFGLLSLYLLLVYYPLPYHSHHIDKMLLISTATLLWAGAFVLQPFLVASLVDGRWYGLLKVGLVNLVVFVMVGEVTFRLIDPLLARSGLFGNKHTPANLKPHTKVWGSIEFSNSQGFRDRERSFNRNGTGPRILALGDSFTYGTGVSYDETCVTLVERALQKGFPEAEVINLGVPGWEPPEEFHLLTTYGIMLQPDLVVLNFFVGKDIMRRRGVYLEEPIVVAGQSYYVHVIGNWFHDTLSPDRWYLYHNVNYLLQLGANRLQRLDAGKGDLGVPWTPRREYLKDIDERSEVYLREDTPVFEHHWKRTRAALEAANQFLQTQQIPLVIVMIPAQEQLDRQLQQELIEALGTRFDQYDFEKPQRVLHAWSAQNRIPVIDLLPTFRKEIHPANLYFVNDMHWNAAGHSMAADGIVPSLRGYLMQNIAKVQ